MTIATTDNRANYTGDGIITEFSFSFKTFAESHIFPYLDGVVQGSGFTVTLNADQDASPGGVVDFSVAPGDGVLVTLERDVPLTQQVDYPEYDPFPSATHERALDTLTQQTQQIDDKIGRAIVAPVTDDGSVDYSLPSATAKKGLKWNDAGDALENTDADIDDILIDATAQADAAASSASAAASSASSASTSASNASGSETNAATSEAKAEDSADAAAASNIDLMSITASVAANALSAGLNADTLSFRNPTLTNGVPNSRAFSTLSLVVPSGATLGCVNAIQSRLILLVIDNAGTIELAVVNQSGGNNLDETTLISTTALSAASDSNNVIYSTTARSNVPFRVVGYIESTQATAGTWVTAPTVLQGAGGNALTAMSSIGHGQTWQDVSGSRVLGTTYYNTTGKPFEIHVTVDIVTAGFTFTITVNGLAIGSGTSNAGNQRQVVSIIIPHGTSYVVASSSSATIIEWSELR